MNGVRYSAPCTDPCPIARSARDLFLTLLSRMLRMHGGCDSRHSIYSNCIIDERAPLLRRGAQTCLPASRDIEVQAAACSWQMGLLSTGQRSLKWHTASIRFNTRKSSLHVTARRCDSPHLACLPFFRGDVDRNNARFLALRRSGADTSVGRVDGDAGWLDVSVLRDAIRQGQEASSDRLLRPRALLLLPVSQRGLPSLPTRLRPQRRRGRPGEAIPWGRIRRLLGPAVRLRAHRWLARRVLGGELPLRQPQATQQDHHEGQSAVAS